MHKYLGFALLSLVCGLGWYFYDNIKVYEADLVPIRYVRTEGVFQYLSQDRVKQTLLPLVNTGFFSADIRSIQKAMQALPWVAQVRVKRIWPDAIGLRVYEQNPYVRWGQDGLLNDKGELFKPQNVNKFEHLPLLNGPSGQEKKTLEIMKGLQTTLTDQDLELKEFTISERRAWKVVLTNGIELILGKNDQLKNFQRFIKTLALFKQEQFDAIAKVDLRYPNGYAVTWKPEAEIINWKKVVEERQQS